MKKTDDIGAFGEKAACRYLRRHGYRIIGRNYRTGHLETDIICEDKTHIVFAEVKTRSDTDSALSHGRPSDAVGYDKKRKLIKGAELYLLSHPTEKSPRMDVVEVYVIRDGNRIKLSGDGIVHIENAFGKN